MPPDADHHPPDLDTPRLWLRRYQPRDSDDFIALMTDPDVTRYTDGPVPLARAHELFAGITSTGHPRVIAAWAVIARGSEAFAGHAAILRSSDPDEPPEIGFLLWPRWWGQGLATEIARAVLAHGHDALAIPRLLATVDTVHVASRRVCEKAGMTLVRVVDDDGDVPYAVYAHDRPSGLR